MKQTNINMIFNNMKQQGLLVTLFVPVKLIEMKLKWIKAIY